MTLTIKYPLRALPALVFTDAILPNNLNSCNKPNLHFYTLSLQILLYLLRVKKDILTSFYRSEIIISKRPSYFSLASHNLVSEGLIQWVGHYIQWSLMENYSHKSILHPNFHGHSTPQRNLVYCM